MYFFKEISFKLSSHRLQWVWNYWYFHLGKITEVPPGCWIRNVKNYLEHSYFSFKLIYQQNGKKINWYLRIDKRNLLSLVSDFINKLTICDIISEQVFLTRRISTLSYCLSKIHLWTFYRKCLKISTTYWICREEMCVIIHDSLLHCIYKNDSKHQTIA